MPGVEGAGADRRRERQSAIRAGVLGPRRLIGRRREQAADAEHAPVEDVLTGAALRVEPFAEPDGRRGREQAAGRAQRQVEERTAQPALRRRVGHAAAGEEPFELARRAAGERPRAVCGAGHTHMFAPSSSLR